MIAKIMFRSSFEFELDTHENLCDHFPSLAKKHAHLEVIFRTVEGNGHKHCNVHQAKKQKTELT